MYRFSEFPRSRVLLCMTLLCLSVLYGCDGSTVKINRSPSSDQPQTTLVFAPAAALEAVPDPSSTFTELDIANETLTLDELQSLIFLPSCSRCHTGGGKDLPASLNLSSSADTYASTIGATSTEDPRLSIVEPYESTNSYLIRKLEGTQSVGRQMPFNQEPLPDWMISAIKRWIDAGAVY